METQAMRLMMMMILHDDLRGGAVLDYDVYDTLLFTECHYSFASPKSPPDVACCGYGIDLVQGRGFIG